MKTFAAIPFIAIALLQWPAAHAANKVPIPKCNKNSEGCLEWIDAVNEINSFPSYPSGPAGGGPRPTPFAIALQHCITYQTRTEHLSQTAATTLCKKLLNTP